jgi:hypothetical protein
MEKFVFGQVSATKNEDQNALKEEQIAGLSKIETIDYFWLRRRSAPCTALELRRRDELERKHKAAISAEAIGAAASELAALKRPAGDV